MSKRVIRLNENDIENLVKRILRESDFDWIEDVVKVETPEEFVINLIDSCETKADTRGYSYKKGDEWYFYQDDKNKRFHFAYYNVRMVLESKFGLNYQEQKDLIGGVLERHYKLKGYTTIHLLL